MNEEPIRFEMRAFVPQEILLQELQGETVLLNLSDERYYGLDVVGSRMFTVLQEAATIEDAYSKLLKEYDVQPDVLRGDLEKFIRRLREHGLVSLVAA